MSRSRYRTFSGNARGKRQDLAKQCVSLSIRGIRFDGKRWDFSERRYVSAKGKPTTIGKMRWLIKKRGAVPCF